MINRVVLVGRITKDPEVKMTSNNASVVTFTLAVNRQFKDSNGERQADFISCVAWRVQADFLRNYVRKGNLLGVEGRIQTRTYESEGTTKYITEVIADSVSLLESKQQQDQGMGQNQNFGQFNQPLYSDNSQINPNNRRPVQNNMQPNNAYQNTMPYNDAYQNNGYQAGLNQNNSFSDSSNDNNSNLSFDISDDDLPF